MKSFKIREGKMLVDGVFYSEKPSDNVIKGQWGRIHSINVMGKQMFPYGGVFNDGTTPIVDSSVSEPTTKKKGKSAKTELKESSSAAVDESGKLVKVKRTKKK